MSIALPPRTEPPPAAVPWAEQLPEPLAARLEDGDPVPFALDWLAALLMFAVALPIIATCWALVRLSSPGPGFYLQTRAGRYGKPFRIVKLRTMRVDAEAKSGAVWAMTSDPRVTAVGKFLRTTHLDELPQLWNILRGEMALVGPRPERPEVIASKGLADRVPGYNWRLATRPGVTGLAQVQLPADSDLASVRAKVRYDVYMMTRGGPWLAARIVVATLLKSGGVGTKLRRRLCRLPKKPAIDAAFRDLLDGPSGPDSVADLLVPA